MNTTLDTLDISDLWISRQNDTDNHSGKMIPYRWYKVLRTMLSDPIHGSKPHFEVIVDIGVHVLIPACVVGVGRPYITMRSKEPLDGEKYNLEMDRIAKELRCGNQRNQEKP